MKARRRLTKQYILIQQNIMAIGANNFQIWILCGECLERT
jgi:hypothetical protein